MEFLSVDRPTEDFVLEMISRTRILSEGSGPASRGTCVVKLGHNKRSGATERSFPGKGGCTEYWQKMHANLLGARTGKQARREDRCQDIICLFMEAPVLTHTHSSPGICRLEKPRQGALGPGEGHLLPQQDLEGLENLLLSQNLTSSTRSTHYKPWGFSKKCLVMII